MNCPSLKSIALQEGHNVQNKQGRGQRRDNPPLCPPAYFLPPLLSPSLLPQLPLFAALLTTVTAALITPL